MLQMLLDRCILSKHQFFDFVQEVQVLLDNRSSTCKIGATPNHLIRSPSSFKARQYQPLHLLC